MRPWNPYAQTFHGESIVGQIPVRVVVHGPPMTGPQMAMLQAAYASFQAGARLSVVRNPSAQGILPDGSRYTIDCVNGACSCVVWTVGGGTVGYMVGGVLRMVGGEAMPDGGFGYKELKENLGTGNDPAKYRTTRKLSRGGVPVVGNAVWNTFDGGDLSGPAAKLAQFGRGACVAYTDYYERKGLNSALERSLGRGVVVFPDGGTKRAFCYGVPEGASTTNIIEMQIAPLSDFPGLKLPAEIKALFGGVPIPPTAAQWASSVPLYSPAEIASLAGKASSSMVGLLQMFPSYASTGEGAMVHFIANFFEYVVGREHPSSSVTSTALFRLDLYLRPDGTVGKNLSVVVGVGITSMNTTQADLPLGTHVGPIGVTHVGGVLTTFTQTMQVREFAVSAPSVEVGPVYEKKHVRTTVAWSGGATGSVVSYFVREYTSVSGETTGNFTISVTGETIEDDLPDGSQRTAYALWTATGSGSATWSHVVKGESNLGAVYAFGEEGAFLVYRTKFEGYVQTGFSGAWNLPATTIRGPAIRTYFEGVWTALPADPPPPPSNWASTVVWYEDEAICIDGTPWEGAYAYSFDESGGVVWTPPTLVGWAAPTVTLAEVASTPWTLQYQGDTLHVGAKTIAVPGLQVLDDFETPEWVAATIDPNTATPVSAPLARGSPLAWIRGAPTSTDVLPRMPPTELAISCLGGHQAIFSIYEHSRRLGAMKSYSVTKGSLVETETDRNYSAEYGTRFIGELQP